MLKVSVLPENIADAVLHFASEARSSRSTDNILNVDGGAKDSYPRACLLRNHGTICVGATVSEAYSRTELLEQMAEIYCRTRTVGEPVVLTAEEVAEVAARIHDYGQSKPLSVGES